MEIIELCLICVGLLLFIRTSKKDRTLLIWLPGFFALTLGFIFTNIEAFFAPEILDFFEHLSLMISGALILYSSYVSFKRKKHSSVFGDTLKQEGILKKEHDSE